jgi:glycosyltransferase involved in cell wall biosynthesis
LWRLLYGRLFYQRKQKGNENLVDSDKNGHFFEDEMKADALIDYSQLGAYPKENLKQGAFNINLQSCLPDLELATQKTTVIIPTLNEATNIKIIINELQDLGYSHILVIDGNSDDNTVDIAKRLGVNVVNQMGKGKGAALRQAFDYPDLCDWVVMMDADGSMDPKEIPSLLEPLKNGADVTKGSRFMKGGRTNDMTLIRRWGNRVFVFLVNSLINAEYTDLCYGYAAFTKKALEKLNPDLKSTSFEIETEIFMKAKILGLQVKEVPSAEAPRLHGKTNLSAWRDGFRILRTILREGLSKYNLLWGSKGTFLVFINGAKKFGVSFYNRFDICA